LTFWNHLIDTLCLTCPIPQAREATPRALELRGKKVVLLLSSIDKGREIELRLLRVGAVLAWKHLRWKHCKKKTWFNEDCYTERSLLVILNKMCSNFD